MKDWQNESLSPYHGSTKGRIVYEKGGKVYSVKVSDEKKKIALVFGRLEYLVWYVAKAFIMPETPIHNKEYYEVIYKDGNPANINPTNLELYYPSMKMVMQGWTQPNEVYKDLMK